MRIFHNKFVSMLLAGLILTACSQPVPKKQEQKPTQMSDGVDILSPPPSNRWVQIDENTRIPVGLHASDAFDWALDDRPIYFHTIEEIERERAEWGPFFSPDNHLWPKFKKLVSLPFQIIVNSPYDRHFARMPGGWNGGWQHGRGVFIGFGEPFSDEYLHMFECGHKLFNANYYRVRDYIIKCHNTLTIRIFLIADLDAPPPPRRAHDDPGRGAPKNLPDRWLQWFLDLRKKFELAHRTHSNIKYSKIKQLNIFVYTTKGATGFISNRFLAPRVHLNDVDYQWSLYINEIPAKHCTSDGLKTLNCLPNNYQE